MGIGDEPPRRPRAIRSDAQRNADHILRVTLALLQVQPGATLEEVAAAAGVARATLYRHFGSRAALVDAARRRAREVADANESDALRPPGELAGGPTPLDVVDVLNKVPPHLMGEQIVSEAQRLAGVTSVAIYLVDIDGTRLLRLAGSEEFPESLDAPLAVGPEIPREAFTELRTLMERELPGSVVAPMFLRGRAVGLLLAVDAPEEPLLSLARHAGASLALAEGYTDVFDLVRRRRETSAAAEIQQHLLPPRIARISGALVAGNVLPGYEIGGDWFDYVENRDGAWLGVADSRGRGTTAAALGSVALGAFRARRKWDPRIESSVLAMHETIQDLHQEHACVNAIAGRWHGPSSTFSWVTAGHQVPLVFTAAGKLVELADHRHDALGIGPRERSFAVDRHRLTAGDRLLLVSDGVLERRTRGGGRFGTEGVRAALAATAQPGAAATVRALEDAILRVSANALEDDATIVVLAPTGPA